MRLTSSAAEVSNTRTRSLAPKASPFRIASSTARWLGTRSAGGLTSCMIRSRSASTVEVTTSSRASSSLPVAASSVRWKRTSAAMISAEVTASSI